MKFQPDRSNAQTISGYGPGWIGVDAEKITHSVILGSGGLRQAWPCARFEDLTPDHFVQLATLEAELVILGSGTRNRFPPPAWLAPLTPFTMEEAWGTRFPEGGSNCARVIGGCAGRIGRRRMAAWALPERRGVGKPFCTPHPPALFACP